MQRNDRSGFYGAKTRFSTIKKESNILQAFFSKGTFLICRLCGKFSREFHPELVKVFHLKICSVFLKIPVRKMRKLLYNNQ